MTSESGSPQRRKERKGKRTFSCRSKERQEKNPAAKKSSGF
jgi:hypothetical protein